MDVWPWEYALFGLSTGSLGGRNMPIAPNCVSAARPDLGVVVREVGNAADWWAAAKGGVGAVHVVPVDP
jgi:hypothetical protein